MRAHVRLDEILRRQDEIRAYVATLTREQRDELELASCRRCRGDATFPRIGCADRPLEIGCRALDEEVAARRGEGR